jgi:hypothetical protein
MVLWFKLFEKTWDKAVQYRFPPGTLQAVTTIYEE